MADSTMPIGFVLSYAGSDPDDNLPDGWLLCDGSHFGRERYKALFAALGTAHGATTDHNFCVPDLRGRFIRGVTGVSKADPDSSTRLSPQPSEPSPGNAGNLVGSVQGYGTAPAVNPMTASIPYLPTGSFGATSPGQANKDMCVVNTPGSAAATVGGGDSETRPINKYTYFIIKAEEGPIPAGSVTAIAGDDGASLSSGWLLCDGASCQVAQAPFAALFTSLGNAHGGDGTTDFCLPDLRGWFVRGVDGQAGRDPDSAARTVARHDLPHGQQGLAGNQVGSVQSFATGMPENGFSTFFSFLPDDGVHCWNTAAAQSAGYTNWDGVNGVNVSQGGGDKESRPVNVAVDWIVLGDPSQSNVPIGSVVGFAGTDPGDPAWISCDGRTLNQAGYPDLFGAIGTNYGTGVGSGGFAVPDLRGLFLRGRDRNTNVDPDAASRWAPNTPIPPNGPATAAAGVIGSVQSFATALPTAAPFTANVPRLPIDQCQIYSWTNDHHLGLEGDSGPIATNTLGGDSQTRPANLYLSYFIRAL